MRLLVVEDSPRLGPDLETGLRADGHAVDLAADGALAIGFIGGYDYDVIVLDLNLPKLDGLSVLRHLRERGSGTRVLVLSARDQIDDRVEALNDGADDYLLKPFAWAELLARIHALARRQIDTPVSLQIGNLRLDPRARNASVADANVALTPKEFALLEVLMSRRGDVLTRSHLFERIYDARSDASDKVIEVLMSTLRSKLSAAGIDRLIETRKGFGYVIA